MKFDKVLPSDGNSFEHITAFAQDKLGYMWWTTKRGLFRYNGYERVNYKFDPLDPKSIPSDDLETICVDTAGHIWVGSLGSGVFRFDPVFEKFTIFQHSPADPGSLSSNWISVLLCDKKGNVWIGSGDGLDRFDPNTGKFIHYISSAENTNTLSGNEVVGLYEDRQGTLWVGTGSIYGENKDDPRVGGLNRMDDISGKFTRFVHDPFDASTLINNKVRAIYESSDGTFWVGTAGDGLHTMDRKTGKFQRLQNAAKNTTGLSRPPLTPDPFSMISFITEDVNGGLWIGSTDNGMQYYDRHTNQSVHVYPGADEDLKYFTNENPWAAFSSAEGVLWIGTIMGNLYTFNPIHAEVPFFPLTTGPIHGFHEDQEGSFWVIAGKVGLLQLDKNKKIIKRFVHDPANPNSFRTNQLMTLTADRNGDLWIGTNGHGIEHFSPKTGKVEHYYRDPKNDNSLSNDTVIRIYEDNKGNIWAGTFRGLNLLNKKTRTFTRYYVDPQENEVFGRNVTTTVLEDRSGKCWVGSYMGGGVHLLNPGSGAMKAYLQGIDVLKLFEDASGKLWAAGSEGLFYYDPATDSFLRFNDPLGLIQILDVMSVVEDDNNSMWLSTVNGIVKISEKRDQVTSYGNHFGIEHSFTYGTIYKAKSGKLLFPAMTGFYELLPDDFNKESKAPRIILSNFRLSNKTVMPGETSVLTKDISVTERIVLKHDQNVFSFDFAAIDFVDPEANKHLFMLENYDQSWNIPGHDRRAMYFNVPPGLYTFRVRAVNAYGKWSEKAVLIEIVPAWWNRWWFRIGLTLAVVALIYFLIKWRLQEKYRLQMERSDQEKELSRLQHRAAQLEMHALRAQMNPHFLFNSLNSINRFILQNNREQASGYLTKFSRLMRLILQNSQYEMIPLENELEALRLYLELEAVRFDHHFSYTVVVDKNLDAAVLKVPPLIIQPYAENAIWHGLMHKEEKGNLLIELREEGEYLVCRITDDGIGRKKAAELKSKSASTHKSMGMKITADRITDMTRRQSNENNIRITDLVLPDGTPGGTMVEIKVLLKYD